MMTGAMRSKAERESPEWIDTENTAERKILDLRSIGMQHALSIGRLRYHRATAPLAEQCHPHWLVLVFPLSGQQQYVIDGQEVDCRGGQMLRILPGSRYSTGARPEQKGELAWLILRTDLSPGKTVLGMSAEGAGAVMEALTGAADTLLHPLPADAPRLIESAFAWWERRDEALAREMIRNRVAALVMEAANAVQPEPRAEDQANDQRIRKVLAWLDEHADAMPSAQEMAAMAGLSATSFFAHFKRITGCSPKDYGLRLRIERAARELRANPDLTVTQVAHACGFSSSQYFATVFRRYLGASPQHYRVEKS